MLRVEDSESASASNIDTVSERSVDLMIDTMARSHGMSPGAADLFKRYDSSSYTQDNDTCATIFGSIYVDEGLDGLSVSLSRSVLLDDWSMEVRGSNKLYLYSKHNIPNYKSILLMKDFKLYGDLLYHSMVPIEDLLFLVPVSYVNDDAATIITTNVSNPFIQGCLTPDVTTN